MKQLMRFWIILFVVGMMSPSAMAATRLEDLPPLPEGTVLFEGEQKTERGRFGGYAMKPCKYGVYPDEKYAREGGEYTYRIRYRKTPYPAFCGAYFVIRGDLSDYATMTFWVKGKKGGETFELGMNDVISNKREDAIMSGSIYRYLPTGITTEWQQVVVPLEDFFGADLHRVFSVVLNFNETSEGTFWVSDVEFHQEAFIDREEEIIKQGYLLVDNFDYSDLNMMGRKTNGYKQLPSVIKFGRSDDTFWGKSGKSLKLEYDKGETGWCGYYSLFNQIDGAYYDLSPYKAVAFRVKGAKGGESFEVGMADKSWLTIGDSVKSGDIEGFLEGGVTTEWREVVIRLEDFGKLDWSQMGSFVLNFHKQGKGTVYVDDLRLLRKSEEDLLQEWEDF